MTEIIVATSGYFDPLTVGHIECFKKAKDLGDKLIVILNTDEQAKLKKRFSFIPFVERKEIIESLYMVDQVIGSIDTDQTQCKTLEMLKPNIFAKGGDRNAGEIPEAATCTKYNIKIVDGLGAKIQSSSWLLTEYVEKVNLLNALQHCSVRNDPGFYDLILNQLKQKKNNENI